MPDRTVEVVTRPWPHIEIDRFLKPEHAERISRDWPTDGWVDVRHSDALRPDGTSKRRSQPVARLFPDIAEELLSGEMMALLCDALDVPPQTLYPVAILVDDAPDYWIRLHPDSAGKVVTCQVYLPTEPGHEDRGVLLQDSIVGHHVKQIPYSFNRGYAFKVAKNTWHRVKRCDGPRRSVQLVYYSTPRM